MSVVEIKSAIAKLPARQKQALSRWLQTQAKGATTATVPVRDISRETLARWMARDEAELRAFRTAPQTARR
jgi:hypothetical protein